MGNQEFHKFDMHLFRDSMQNYKVYQIPKAQLIIADVPYNLGTNAYGSNPSWYVDGDNKNGESDKAGKKFFKDAKEKVLSSFEPDMFQRLEFDEREKKKQKFLSKAVDDGQHGDR